MTFQSGMLDPFGDEVAILGTREDSVSPVVLVRVYPKKRKRGARPRFLAVEPWATEVDDVEPVFYELVEERKHLSEFPSGWWPETLDVLDHISRDLGKRFDCFGRVFVRVEGAPGRNKNDSRVFSFELWNGRSVVARTEKPFVTVWAAISLFSKDGYPRLLVPRFPPDQRKKLGPVVDSPVVESLATDRRNGLAFRCADPLGRRVRVRANWIDWDSTFTLHEESDSVTSLLQGWFGGRELSREELVAFKAFCERNEEWLDLSPGEWMRWIEARPEVRGCAEVGQVRGAWPMTR